MANLFLNLPVPSSNGPGAAVNTLGMGATKTIVVGGSFNAAVTIEYSCDDAATIWAPLKTFHNPGRITLDVGAHHMRAVTSKYKGGSANADVGAATAGSLCLSLTGGASVDISSLPALKTVIVSGKCIVEVSEDGVSWSQAFAFENQGGQTARIFGQFARVTGGATADIVGANDDGSSQGLSPASRQIVYTAANNLSKQPGTDPMGLLVNPVFGTPDGIAVIEVIDDPATCSCTGQLIMQPQPEGWMPVVPYRTPTGALVYNAESHHFQISNDRTRLYGFGISTNFVYVYDIEADNQYHPQLIASIDLEPSGFMGPHDAYEMDDGTLIVTMSGSVAAVPSGAGPGGLIQIDRDGNILADVTPVGHAFFTSAAISISINEANNLAYPEFQTHFYFDQWPPSPLQVGFKVTFFTFDPAVPGPIPLLVADQQVDLIDPLTPAKIGYHATSPTWWPVALGGKEVLFVMTIAEGMFALHRNWGSADPFVAQLVYPLPAGNAYPAHACMHGILQTLGTQAVLKYNKLYVTDTWGNTLHVLDMSGGLPAPGTYFQPLLQIDNPNIHWAAFNIPATAIYTSNMLYTLYDYNLGKYPLAFGGQPGLATTYELRKYVVDDTTGMPETEPVLRVPAPVGYGFVKFKLRFGATHPGVHE